jgi:FtsH-binding integral membrane protein
MFGARYDPARLTPLGWGLFALHIGLLVGIVLSVFLFDSKMLLTILGCLFVLVIVLVWTLEANGDAVHKAATPIRR